MTPYLKRRGILQTIIFGIYLKILVCSLNASSQLVTFLRSVFVHPIFRWFSDPNVRKALNVCGTAGAASFGGCSAGCIAFPKSFGTTDTLDNVGTLARVLESNIPVLMVYGMTDMTTCNYEGWVWWFDCVCVCFLFACIRWMSPCMSRSW